MRGRALFSFAIIGAAASALGACGILIGLDEHEPFPDTAHDAGHHDAKPEPCELTRCGEACVDPKTDAEHCGGCDHACADGFSCTEGECGEGVVSVASGALASCVLLREGKVYCWGGNAFAELGVLPGADDDACDMGGPCRPTPVHAESLENVTQLSLGFDFGCAVTKAKKVVCWGKNDRGQLGHETGDTACVGGLPCSAEAREVVGVPSAVEVSAGLFHACARTVDKEIYCWGNNEFGELGNGSFGKPNPTPSRVLGVSGAVAVSASKGQHTCAIGQGGSVFCWGLNRRGALGHAPDEDDDCGGVSCSANALAVQVDATGNPLLGATSLAAGSDVTCARIGNAVSCWGSNGLGGLGLGDWDTMDHPNPLPVAGAPKSVFGGNASFCSVEDGAVSCWGDDRWRALGDGTQNAPQCEGNFDCRSTPTRVDIGKVKELSLGGQTAVVLKEDGSVFAWGMNKDGQAGHLPGEDGDALTCGTVGNQACAATPVRVKGLP